MKTKNAKKADVFFTEEMIPRTIVKYSCPSCRINFTEYSFHNDITRFKCSNCR